MTSLLSLVLCWLFSGSQSIAVSGPSASLRCQSESWKLPERLCWGSMWDSLAIRQSFYCCFLFLCPPACLVVLYPSFFRYSDGCKTGSRGNYVSDSGCFRAANQVDYMGWPAPRFMPLYGHGTLCRAGRIVLPLWFCFHILIAARCHSRRSAGVRLWPRHVLNSASKLAWAEAGRPIEFFSW